MGDTQDTGTDTATADQAATEPTRTKTPSWVPDNPTPEPEQEPEAEEVDEQPDEETPADEPESDEVDEDDDTDEGEPEEEADEPEATDEADSPDEGEEGDDKGKGHSFDKGVQKLQQRQAAFEQKTSDRLDQIAQAIETLAEKPAQPDEPRPQSDASTEAKTEPDEDQGQLLETLKSAMEGLRGEVEGDDADPDEYLTVAQVRKRDERISKAFDSVGKAFETLVTSQRKTGEPDELKGIREEVKQLKQERERQQADIEAQAQAEKYWNKFKAENAFDGQQLWLDAQKQAVKDNPDSPPDAQFGYAKALFKTSVAEKKAALKADKETAKKKPAEAKKNTTQRTPRQSTKGTQTVTPGATTTRPASRDGKRQRPPSWVPD